MDTHPWGSATVTSYAPGVHLLPAVFPMSHEKWDPGEHRMDNNSTKGVHNERIERPSQGTAKFRITFRSEIFVDAASEEEARDKFGSMTMGEIGQNSNFVEIVSCEKE